jgi:hypothetical protein
MTVDWNLENYRSNVTSQLGEDGIIAQIFHNIGVTNRFCVEFGAGDAHKYSNTWALREVGWASLLMDGDPRGAKDVVKTWITRENINELFEKRGVPACVDLLSIDLDGNDLWIWQALNHSSRVTIVEFNAMHPMDQSLTIPYDPKHVWDGTSYYGASLLALERLAMIKGQQLVWQNGQNAIFVDCDLLPAFLHVLPNYEVRSWHPLDPKRRPFVCFP